MIANTDDEYAAAERRLGAALSVEPPAGAPLPGLPAPDGSGTTPDGRVPFCGDPPGPPALAGVG